MPIEFRCPECQKLLRVPDESAGAKAKCPQCSAIVAIPDASAQDAGDPFGLPPNENANPFSEDIQPQQPAPKPTSDGSINPYSSPVSHEGESSTKSFSSTIVATPADVGQIINYAWAVWKANLGLLVGITVLVMVISMGVGIVQVAIEAMFAQQDQQEIGQLFGFLLSLVGNVIQIFLGIGQAMIVLKLLRGQPAEFSDLFNGGPLFMRVLGASILAGIVMIIGFIACVIPGIILAIIFWPFYWLVVDEKATAIESFGMAAPIGKANVGTSILLWLVSTGIIIVGMLAFCVGIFLAAPLVSLIWGTAYLMMSGQLTTQPRY